MPKIDWIKERIAAEKIGLQPRTLRKYAKSGRIPVNYTTRESSRGYQYDQKGLDKYQLNNSTVTTI
jgi:DNA-binding transcriptional MerR regulator